MPSRLNVTNERYGRLVAIEYVGVKKIKSRDKYQSRTLWRFKCDCGNVIVTPLAHARSGRTRSCGCLKIEQARSLAKRLKYGESSFNGLFAHYRGTCAIARDYSWGLTREQFKEIVDSNCHYCGQPPSQICRANKDSFGSYVYSGIDRVNNELGYEIGNVVPCCTFCNRAKLDDSEKDFLSWVERVHGYQERKHYAK